MLILFSKFVILFKVKTDTFKDIIQDKSNNFQKIYNTFQEKKINTF